MFLLSDDYGNFKELMNYKELKNFMISEIIGDAKENYNDYDIVSSCIDKLGKLAKDDTYNLEYIESELNSYGWSVLSIAKVQKALSDLMEFWSRKHDNLKAFDDILEFLDEELTK